MKQKWISTDERLPVMNEIIIYKGNLSGAEGRHMGNGFVELKNGRVDQFDEWKPVYDGYVTMAVQHPEKKQKIEVKGKIINNEFVGEFWDGITFGITIPLDKLTTK